MTEWTDEDDERIEAAVTALFKEVKELGGSVEGLAMAALKNVGVNVEEDKDGWFVNESPPIDHEDLARLWIWYCGFNVPQGDAREHIRDYFEGRNLTDKDADIILDLIRSATYNLKTTSRTFP